MSGAPAPAPRRGFAVASLVLGILGLPTVGLVGVGAMAGIVLGVVALVKSSRAPTEYGGRGMAVAGIVLSAFSVIVAPFVIGVIAAIAIPSLLRARLSANEAAAIGDVRSVLVAEAAYQSANGGYYDRLECLAEPGACIPAYAGPSMLGPDIARATVKSGYRRSFHAGAPASPRPPAVSPTSMMSFAYAAVPAQPGATGVRAFCGDATGVVCFTRDGALPSVLAGVCPAECQALR